MSKADGLVDLLKRHQLKGGEGRPTGKRRRIVDRSRTAWVALGTVAVALQSTWVLDYDPATRGLLQARYFAEEVTDHGDGKLNLIVATPIVTFFTTTGTHDWELPADWNPGNNTVECIGGGANGLLQTAGSVGAACAGGGGGAYARVENLPLVGGTTVSVHVATSSDSSWFVDSETVLAVGATSRVGGAAGDCVGDVCYSGGDGNNGFNYTPSALVFGGSGGGAAGPDGDGGDSTSVGSSYPYRGGTGGGTGGGEGGWRTNRGDGPPGGNGTNWDESHGAGGGGCGAFSSQAGYNDGGDGGLYGGGGGGCYRTGTFQSVSVGQGAQGIVVATYEPATNTEYTKTVSCSVGTSSTIAKAVSRSLGVAAVSTTATLVKGARKRVVFTQPTGVTFKRAVSATRETNARAAASTNKAITTGFATAVSATVSLLTPRTVVQAINTAVETASTLIRATGKLVLPAVSTAVAQRHAIAFTVKQTAKAAVTIPRAIVFTLRHTASTSVSVVKQTAKLVIADTVQATATLTKRVSKIVRNTVIVAVLWATAVYRIVSRQILQDPVDCVIEWERDMRESWRTYEGGPQRTTSKSIASKGKGGRLSGGTPSFTTKTNNRGYD